MKLIKRTRYYNKFEPFTLFIKVDESCNLACSFCYQKNKKKYRLDTEEKFANCFKNLDVAIKKFLEYTKDPDFEYSTICICFFGGEPTLNTEAINRICDYISQNYSYEERQKIAFTYTTNGIIFNDKIKETLKKMKSVNDLNVGVMISTDNDKEVYDKNRKLIGSNESGFDIVQKNIKLYKEFLLKEVNKKEYEKDVTFSTVLATPEQILTNHMYIQNEYKDIIRRGKFLYATEVQSNEYIEASKKFLENAYNYLIDKVEKENKEEVLDEIQLSIFHLTDVDYALTECQNIVTIDGNGDLNWCNTHRYFENEILSQDIMREYVYNKNVDNSHFKCYKEKFHNGSLTKDLLQDDMWKKLISKFDINMPIPRVNIDYNSNDIKVQHFIKYMIGSTNDKDRRIYIFTPNKEIINICEEFDIKISKEKINNEYENVFYIDENGNLFFDEIFKENKDMILTNLKEHNFMWIHTPTLIKSINEFYYNKINNLDNK